MTCVTEEIIDHLGTYWGLKTWLAEEILTLHPKPSTRGDSVLRVLFPEDVAQGACLFTTRNAARL